MATPSYEKIDYSVRPAKHAERRMMFEMLRRLDRLEELTSYRYIGFGSPFFVDFRAVHMGLGIHDLVSVEAEETNQERFEFNRPFGCVRIEYGTASRVLPTLRWEQRSIVWLDYDGPMDEEALGDIELLIHRMTPGSVVLASFNVHPPTLDSTPNCGLDPDFAEFSEVCSFAHRNPKKSRADVVRERLGDAVPAGMRDVDLGGWKLAALCREVFNFRVEETLKKRNRSVGAGKKLAYRQLMNFRYSDGAKMATFGGIIYDENQAERVEACKFSDFPWFRSDDESYEIKVPNLTRREMAMLLAQIRGPQGGDVVAPNFLPLRDVSAYVEGYRFLPSYVDVEVS